MRARILSETIMVRTVNIIDPDTEEPTGETKEVLYFTIAFGADRRHFAYDMPPDKPMIVADVKTAAQEVMANRQKAQQIRNWLKERDLLEFDTDEL